VNSQFDKKTDRSPLTGQGWSVWPVFPIRVENVFLTANFQAKGFILFLKRINFTAKQK
jgi:hypothetical protein